MEKHDSLTCILGADCFNLNCSFSHPPTSKLCTLGAACVDFNCNFLHPNFRTQCCSLDCNNPSCENLHPSNWNPSAIPSNKLRSQIERDRFRTEQDLPILKIKEEFIARLKIEKFLVITAETGSGKTTQLPQYAAEAFPGKVICTQPRAIAAMSLAQRIAYEFDNSSVGENVGYTIAGSKGVKGKKIKLMTDAALVKKTQKDSNLKKVSVLIIDEAHERSLNTDLVVGIAKLIRNNRPNDFYVVIASATINPQSFLEFFAQKDQISQCLSVKGRVFPITDEKSMIDFDGTNLDKLIGEIIRILIEHDEGNMLVFLPGASEIEKAIKIFENNFKKKDSWILYPLYGALPPEKQAEVMAFNAHEQSLRMIVFCTNIAETSLTVPNIRIVLDSGLAKEARYDIKRRINIIEEVYISKSSAQQRRGRAGRTAEGVFVRLYSEDKLTRENIEPEIMRSSLDLVVLQLKMLSFDPLTFPFISKPNEEFLKDSIELLISLGCLKRFGENPISPRGRFYSQLPFDPKITHFLIKGSEDFGKLEEFSILASLLTAPGNLFFMGGTLAERKEKKEFLMNKAKDYSSDIEMNLAIYNEWYDSGIVVNNTCQKCNSSISKFNVQKDDGCRQCRVKFTKINGLNNKILEIIHRTKKQSIKIIKSSSNFSPKILIKSTKNAEAIGICMLEVFHEQLGELVMPGNPASGVYLIHNGLKGVISKTSTCAQKCDKDLSDIIGTKITQIPNGMYIIDSIHPINPSWITEEIKALIKQKKKEFQQCYFIQNLNVKFEKLLSKKLWEEGKTQNWAKLCFVSFDHANSLLQVFGPKENSQTISNFCENLIEEQRIKKLNETMDVTLSHGIATVTLGAGMILKEIQKGDINSLKFSDPRITSLGGQKFKEWLSEKAKIDINDIRSTKFEKANYKHEAHVIVSFKNKEAARKAQMLKEAEISISEAEEKVQTIKLTLHEENLSCNQLQSLLRNKGFNPIKIKNLFNSSKEFSIFINFLPIYCNSPEDLRREIPTRNFDDFIDLSFRYNRNNYPYAILTFSSFNGRNTALNFLLDSDFQHTVSYKTKKEKVYPAITKGTEKEISEYFVTFSSLAEAESFYQKYRKNGSINGIKADIDGYSCIKVDKFNLYHNIQEYLENMKEEQKFDYKYQEKYDSFALVRFFAQSPFQIAKAVGKLQKKIAPLYLKLSNRKSQFMLEELENLELLKNWDLKYRVHHKLFQNSFDETYYKLEVYGDQIQQGLFMGEIVDYSDSFDERYSLIHVQSNFKFLFKKDMAGDIFVRKLNNQFKEPSSIEFLYHISAIELYIDPSIIDYKILVEDIIKKINEFFNDHLDQQNNDEIQKEENAFLCVFCDRNGTNNFIICGHFFCNECLMNEIQNCSTNGEKLVCKKCDTLISVNDIKNVYFVQDLSEILINFLKTSKSSEFVVCPIENCFGLKLKTTGYTYCTDCGNYTCSLCSAINSKSHLGITCEEFLKKKQERLKKCKEFMDNLFKKAEKFVSKNWNDELGKVLALQANIGINSNCPSMRKFQKALLHYPINKGFFAWHGTKSEEGVLGICHEGFDPKRRAGQIKGPGEYFGQTSSISHNYSCQTSRMIVAYLLASPFTSKHGNFCYVVNNPIDFQTAYNLPILVLTYGRQLPMLKFISENGNDSNNLNSGKGIPENAMQSAISLINDSWKLVFRWFWQDDNNNFRPYMEDVNRLIEENYNVFCECKGPNEFETPFIIRFVDDKPQKYRINFKNLEQINKKTSYTRNIKREKVDIPCSNIKWQYLNENGNWISFDNLVQKEIDNYFMKYYGGNGSGGKAEGVKFPGRPENYTLDFVHGIQINQESQTSRGIRRIIY